VAVTLDGELWVWGCGLHGQLGLYDHLHQQIPSMIGTESALGELQVLTASCGYVYTMAVTKDGALWTVGMGGNGTLGHNDHNNTLVLTRVEAQHFGNSNIFSTAFAYSHSAAVTEEGILFTWGDGDESSGLWTTSEMLTWISMRVDPGLMQGAHIGPCHNLLSMHALAFARERILDLAVTTAQQLQ